jgi:hypothetical protein
MTQSHVDTRVSELFFNIRAEINDTPGSIIHANKVLNNMIRKYGLWLTDQEEQSLRVQIGRKLAQMYDEGKLGKYRDRSPIRYSRGAL